MSFNIRILYAFLISSLHIMQEKMGIGVQFSVGKSQGYDATEGGTLNKQMLLAGFS